MSKACYKCMRYSVLVFNFLFVLIGIGVLACAIFATVDESTKSFLKFSGQDDYVSYVLYGLMAVGGVTMLIGLFGCCGAYHESQCLLTTYFLFLILIFLAEVAAGVLGYLFRAKVLSKVDEAITKEKDNKKTSMTVETNIDRLQRFIECCGAAGPADYDTKIPESCCDRKKYTNDQCGTTTIVREKAYQQGCQDGYKTFVKKNFLIILGVLVGIAGIELLGIIFAIAACCSIRRRDTAYTTVEAHDDPYR